MTFFDFVRLHQLNIMLFLSGACGILTVLTLVTKALKPRRRTNLALLELSAMLLLVFDRFAYLDRGRVGQLAYWMVRISNFLVFFLALLIMHLITRYIYELCASKTHLSRMPVCLVLCEVLFALGVLLLVVSQFTGFYYTFDAQNRYQRGAGNYVSFLLPLMIPFLQASVVLSYRKVLSKRMVVSLLLTALVPVAASTVQIFTYGTSLTNITLVGMVIILYIYVLIDLNSEIEQARKREIDFYREEREKEHDLFVQTADALVNAIDAKDRYTNGHSHRVAEYSRMIAREAGKPEEYCEDLYFTALLHDVGKIGISDAIINKVGKLTAEEYGVMQEHPAMGSQILTSIEQSPYLSEGANYHHERYDGKGYPKGLKGEEIPEMARIIAVADAYDAMTSKRSYRSPLSQDTVRAELTKERGKQFDPRFADIMLRLIDRDSDYRMREPEDAPETQSPAGGRAEALNRAVRAFDEAQRRN